MCSTSILEDLSSVYAFNLQRGMPCRVWPQSTYLLVKALTIFVLCMHWLTRDSTLLLRELGIGTINFTKECVFFTRLNLSEGSYRSQVIIQMSQKLLHGYPRSAVSHHTVDSLGMAIGLCPCHCSFDSSTVFF